MSQAEEERSNKWSGKFLYETSNVLSTVALCPEHGGHVAAEGQTRGEAEAQHRHQQPVDALLPVLGGRPLTESEVGAGNSQS